MVGCGVVVAYAPRCASLGVRGYNNVVFEFYVGARSDMGDSDSPSTLGHIRGLRMPSIITSSV